MSGESVFRIGLEMEWACSMDGLRWEFMPCVESHAHIPIGFNPQLLRYVTVMGGKNLREWEIAERFFPINGIETDNRILLVEAFRGKDAGLKKLEGKTFMLRLEEHLNGSPNVEDMYQYTDCTAKVATVSTGAEEVMLAIADVTYKSERFEKNAKSVLRPEAIEDRYKAKESEGHG